MYRKIIVHEIKDGELIRWDPLMEEFEASFIENEEKRDKTDTIGYYAMFEYVDGFRKRCTGARIKCLCMQTSTALHLVKMRMQS